MVAGCLASFKIIANHGSILCNPPRMYHLEMSVRLSKVGFYKSSKFNPGVDQWFGVPPLYL